MAYSCSPPLEEQGPALAAWKRPIVVEWARLGPLMWTKSSLSSSPSGIRRKLTRQMASPPFCSSGQSRAPAPCRCRLTGYQDRAAASGDLAHQFQNFVMALL
jgi:hypothetical protein